MLLHDYTANMAGIGLGMDGVGDVFPGQMDDLWPAQPELEILRSYELLLILGRKFH